MKKSKVVKLVLLGSAALALAACNEDKYDNITDEQAFRGQNECVTKYSDSDCDNFQKKANEVEHPKYSRKEDCEQQFGKDNCETRHVGGAHPIFMPYLWGYTNYGAPLYRTADSSIVKNNQGNFTSVKQTTQGSYVRSSTRGGFGASGRGVSVAS